MVTLTVNGKPTDLEKATPLEQFLQDREVKLQFVAVAYNGLVLRREEFSTVTLDDGDIVEIVRPVGGG